MDNLEEVNKIEGLKNKVLKTLEGCTVYEIQQVTHYIFANIDKIAVYNPIKKIKVEEVELKETVKVQKQNITVIDPNEYPINGTWKKKLEFMFTKILDKEKSYSSTEIAEEFANVENKDIKEISQPVYSVLSYTIKYPQPWINEVTGLPYGKRYQYKFS